MAARAEGEPSAVEPAAMASATDPEQLMAMCDDPQILRLPAALRRANLQSWRCTLHRDRLVSALALAHKISPPRGTLEAQLAFVRARLRAHAVFLACGAPFGAWAQFARRSWSVPAQTASPCRRIRASALAFISWKVSTI